MIWENPELEIDHSKVRDLLKRAEKYKSELDEAVDKVSYRHMYHFIKLMNYILKNNIKQKIPKE